MRLKEFVKLLKEKHDKEFEELAKTEIKDLEKKQDAETDAKAELESAQAKVAGVYQKLIKHWHEIIDIPGAEELAR